MSRSADEPWTIQPAPDRRTVRFFARATSVGRNAAATDPRDGIPSSSRRSWNSGPSPEPAPFPPGMLSSRESHAPVPIVGQVLRAAAALHLLELRHRVLQLR